ncbi:hypothetical protein WG70_17405 [Burkholderia oklahomensis EO147]|nr:hypothetical protein WG70_17405 [Burkholderia oklahomensis EO147]KUY63964.1 hypothetical protein WG70_31075 [Burkholderia oklahomensis EO147]
MHRAIARHAFAPPRARRPVHGARRPVPFAVPRGSRARRFSDLFALFRIDPRVLRQWRIHFAPLLSNA